MTYSKIKAEIFKLSTCSKLTSQTNTDLFKGQKKIASNLKNDELGYFSSLEGL